MRKRILHTMMILFAGTWLFGQTTEVVADWETTETSLTWTTFNNGSLNDSLAGVVQNPNVSGVNLSDSVVLWTNATDGQTWAGFYMDPAEALDFTGIAATISMDVLMGQAGSVMMKLENATDGSAAVTHSMDYTTANEWQTLCFDYTVADGEGDIGTGHIYERIALFFDFGVVPAAEVPYWFDNITKTTGGDPDLEMIADWETPETSVTHFSFGNGHFGDSVFITVANPSADAVNASDSAQQWCKADNATTWGGFAMDVDTLDFTGSKATICIDYFTDHTAELSMKLEGSETGPDLSSKLTYDTPNEWKRLSFDFALGDDDGDVGLGHLYHRITLFPDFGTVPGSDVCYYFDNLSKITNGGGGVLELLGNYIQNSADHAILTELLDSADMWNLINSSGVTVFAPTDDAFNALPAGQLNALMNNTDNSLFNTLLHHVTYDSLPSDLLTLDLHFITRNGQDGIVTTAGSAVANANISEADIAGANGILHVMDAVLEFPADPDQIVHFDYETPEMSPVWNYFCAPGPPIFESVANPAPDTVNESATVAKYQKMPAGDTWQGIYTDLARPVNLFGTMKKLYMDVWFDHEGFLRAKMEQSSTGLPNASWVAEITVTNGWNTICWDLSQPSVTDGLNANNHILNRMTLFFDFENSAPLPDDTVTYYFDNLVQLPLTVNVVDNEMSTYFKVYPNPATNWLIVDTDIPVRSVSILDITGKELIRVDHPDNYQIDISSLTGGIYLIRFTDNHGNTQGISKFLKN